MAKFFTLEVFIFMGVITFFPEKIFISNEERK